MATLSGFDIVPVAAIDVLDGVPVDTVSVGVRNGDADMLADAPLPAELTALTLNTWVSFDSPVKVWLVALPTDVHALLLRDTSYLVIEAPPVLDGTVQDIVT